MSSDIVFIQNLHIETVIGVYDWEQNIRQTVQLDLEMACDVRIAARDDDLQQAVDYQAVSDRLIEYVGGSRIKLIETLAQRCAELVLREFQVSWLRLRIRKPGAVAAADSVGIQIERSLTD